MENDNNSQSFIALYQSVYQDMYRFALYTLGHPQDAEDAVSDAVMDGYRSFHKLKSKDSFRPWIFKILTAKCKRKLKEYVHKTTELPDNLSYEASLDTDLATRQAFARLSDKERLIISMHIFGGYSSREIGTFLHMNENTVRSRESRALNKMRTWLEN